MIDPAFKLKWCEALESGKYLQASGALRRNKYSFCCLGVALDLIDATKWSRSEGYMYYYGQDRGMMPEAERELIHLSESEAINLMELNDGKKTFLEISQYIKENL